MRVVLFGGSGMVGQGVLRECLLDPEVETVLCVGRTPVGRSAPKLTEAILPDLGNLAAIEEQLGGYDAGFFPLGVSAMGKTEAEFRKVTFDLTIGIARTLARLNPGMTFVYVSGAGTDETERGRAMWVRVKGATENALLALPFRAAYMFRPGAIQPLHGIRSKTRLYRFLYIVLRPVIWLLSRVAPDSMTTTEAVGKAMIQVARVGAPTKRLSNREINALAAERTRSAHSPGGPPAGS